jgi:hypothetical protein
MKATFAMAQKIHTILFTLHANFVPQKNCVQLKIVEGQSNEIFDFVFFSKKLIVVSVDISRSDLKFCQIFAESFKVKIQKIHSRQLFEFEI